MTTKITLPTGKEALVIKVTNLNSLTVNNLKNLGIANAERYVCLVFQEGDNKASIMGTKQELTDNPTNAAIILEELKNQLKIQMAVLRQL